MNAIDRNIDRVVLEGLMGITPRDHRPDTATSLERGAQAIYFARIRDDMNSYAASRVMTVGVDQSANTLFRRLKGT